jgi:hypothetical protein
MLSSISTKPVSVRRRRHGRGDAAHRRHLHAQQLAAAGAGDELRRRVGGAALQPLLHAFQRMRHQLAVEHGVDAAPQPISSAPPATGASDSARNCSARGCCRAGCGRPGCTPPRSASARPSAPPGGLRSCSMSRLACALRLVHVGSSWPRCATSSLTARAPAPAPAAPPGHRQRALHVAADQHLRLLGQARRCGHPAHGTAPARSAGERQHHQRHQTTSSGHARAQQRRPRRALLRSSVARTARAAAQPTAPAARPAPAATAVDLRAVDLHARAASISRTLATSSLVEKGLVM